MSLLSVIVPCYNEEENVDCFYEELMKIPPFLKKKGWNWKSCMWMTVPKTGLWRKLRT